MLSKKVLAPLAGIAILALVGCSGGDKVTTVGQPLEVKAGDAKLSLTVTDIENTPLSDVPELELDTDYQDGTAFFVHFTAEVVGGTYGADDSYFLGDQKWAAGGTEDIATVSFGYFGTPEIPGCELMSSDLAEKLSAGGTIEACQVFAAAGADAKIEKVVYGQPAISYKGRSKGWVWNVE